ncbi:uncharacterized protein YbjT (DUF2867 family) [Antricoccus suffuscus]|uniref:Uncharacterized protein YbjT (DUF2867 family) n=1 Tax=Antricoccus suffuscus TaxID=1629062 RepID=A0A2T0ZXW1_9ACTN|nr:NAD(P)H-binding protein [Antricoccus suffuscus]PRZ41173.1 uncharacterized protein YbjT (DUF2867 family) [Antricoccus suffuscus]
MGKLLVTGATGTLGTPIVTRLLDLGHEVRAASRSAPHNTAGIGGKFPYRIDFATATPTEVEAAVDGMDTVIHCATSGRSKRDVEMTRALVAAATAKAAHFVYISIVGIDDIPLGYYKGKAAAERVIARSDVSWSILRTTQFHNLVASMCAGIARIPAIAPIPKGVSFQPIAVGEVADRLVEIATGPAIGRATDMGGPEVGRLHEFFGAWAAHNGVRRRAVSVPLPGAVGKALRQGGNLAPDHAVGSGTFAQFLAE